mmetsp:Transcript_29243/g.68024  ORF Transcript_29243/g.68024 Transcript_29243/m.68024 type:complete len:226 (+) Transcript_29243:441-1118(+)
MCAKIMMATFATRNHGLRILPLSLSVSTPMDTLPKQLKTEISETSTEVEEWLPPSAMTIWPTLFRTTRPPPMPTNTTRNNSQKLAEVIALLGGTSAGVATSLSAGWHIAAVETPSAVPVGSGARLAHVSCHASNPKHTSTMAKLTRFSSRRTPHTTRNTSTASSRQARDTTRVSPLPKRTTGSSRSRCRARGTRHKDGAQSAPKHARPTPRKSRNSEVLLSKKRS